MSITKAKVKMVDCGNQIQVGSTGKYTTLKAAVDWFNASATANTVITLDAGHHAIADTVTVNNGTYSLKILGQGYGVTALDAATGLATKPMFNIKSMCDIWGVTANGSTLGSYGTQAGENFITFDTTHSLYSEISDIVIDTFKVGISDTIGVDKFIFNFIISNCAVGIVENYSTGAITTTLDAEVGNFENCPVGIHLQKATTGSFILTNLVFLQANSTDVAIQYVGGAGNYVLGDVTNISGCTFNNVGEFETGFDFTLTTGRDANISMRNNVGMEEKTPHAKINVVDNTVTTTITTANTYYKLNGVNSKYNVNFDLAATAGNFTISYHGETTGNIAYNASAATIKGAIEALTNITTVTVVQIVASKEWTIEFVTAGEGWAPDITVDIAGLTTTTAVIVTPSFYTCKFDINNNRITMLSHHVKDCVMWITGNLSCDQANRNVNVAVKRNNTGNVIAPFTVRTATQNVAYPFGLIVYLEDVGVNEYLELFSTSTTNGDIVRLWDLNVFIDSK